MMSEDHRHPSGLSTPVVWAVESVVVVVGMQRWRAVLLDPHALGLSLDQLILLLHV